MQCTESALYKETADMNAEQCPVTDSLRESEGANPPKAGANAKHERGAPAEIDPEFERKVDVL